MGIFTNGSKKATIGDTFTSWVNFLLFGIPFIPLLIVILIDPNVLAHFRTILIVWIILSILWWVFCGFLIINHRKKVKLRKEEEARIAHERDLEKIRAANESSKNNE